MTRKELENHKGPVWVRHTVETAIPISDWSLDRESPKMILDGLLALESNVFPSEQACLESIIEHHLATIKDASAHIDMINARINRLNGGIDKGI